MQTAACFFLSVGLATAALVPEVRQATEAGDFLKAERLIELFRTKQGVTPELILATSWLGRGALAARRYGEAEKYAARVKQLTTAELRRRKLDAEPDLPLALGAAIEVQGQVLAAQGARDQAIHYLREQLAAYRNTSIVTRIQKNINLLGLEGKPAPALQGVSSKVMQGKVALLFFWAHWCSDCKSMADTLAKLRAAPWGKSFVLVAPTQTYGYAEAGREVLPTEETRYIEQVRKQFYPALGDALVPISTANFQKYGSSTTPTVVLLDRAGIVRLYHPGTMRYEELASKIQQLLNGQ